MTDRKITPFLFEGEITVRVIERDSLPWFVAADVCRALGVRNARDAVSALDSDEKDVALTDTPGGQQEMLIISEGGLFTLMLRSRDAMKKGTLPHRFRRWVTGEVLPAMRRAGQGRTSYAAAESDCALPEALSLRMVEVARHVFGVQAAGQLWFKRNLPTVPAMRSAPVQADLFMPLGSPNSGSPSIVGG